MFNVYNIISQEKIEQSMEKGEGFIPPTFIGLHGPGSVLDTFAYFSSKIAKIQKYVYIGKYRRKVINVFTVNCPIASHSKMDRRPV